MEDPDLQNQGNQILSILLGKPETSSQISFKEFSDPSDMVTFNFKDNKIFYSSKQILANASVYFMRRFFGPNAKYDDDTIIFDDVTSENFNIFMNHIYHPTRVITETNLEIILPLAFTVLNLLIKCERYLLDTEKLFVDEKKEYAEKYDLEWLLSACNNFKEAASRYQ
uniref:BTB domain-containing protein n=1 Tax=Caenorhabditis tropicalis TaxID=1561998 RepID=A0A1I7T9Y6_9PELO